MATYNSNLEPIIETNKKLDNTGALMKYSGHKQWYSKYMKKVASLLELIKKQYSRSSEERINKFLTKVNVKFQPCNRFLSV